MDVQCSFGSTDTLTTLAEPIVMSTKMISDSFCARLLPGTEKKYLRYSALVGGRLIWVRGFRGFSPCSLGPDDFDPVVKLYCESM